MSHPDQQTTGTDANVPCPWCGKKQDLTTLEIEVDARITCDDCEKEYVLAQISPMVSCPQCHVWRPVTLMESQENAVTHCPVCHRVFRPADAKETIHVVLERAA
jgi:uncharacterized Zn-finger protein